MKNPNGYGCIKLLSGSRRRPYCFVVSQQGKQKVIGYFATKLEAMAYQVDYNQSHGLHRLSACFTITGSPERNKNDRYAYRTGYHIVWKNESQFCYAIGTEQQGQYFEWVAIGR